MPQRLTAAAAGCGSGRLRLLLQLPLHHGRPALQPLVVVAMAATLL